jgi:hypothetical protein
VERARRAVTAVGAAAVGALALRGRPGSPAEYHGPKGVPASRLRRGRTHRFDVAMVRWCGGLVRRHVVVSLLEKGSVTAPMRSQSCGEGRER